MSASPTDMPMSMYSVAWSSACPSSAGFEMMSRPRGNFARDETEVAGHRAGIQAGGGDLIISHRRFGGIFSLDKEIFPFC